jgi:hypothetical protein
MVMMPAATLTPFLMRRITPRRRMPRKMAG